MGGIASHKGFGLSLIVDILSGGLGGGGCSREGASRIGNGFFVVAIRPPAVPIGTSRLRITVTADHTSSQIEELVSVLNKLQKKLIH